MLVTFVIKVARVLLGEEAREEEREGGEEDDRLGRGHRDAGDLLVEDRREPHSRGAST